MPLSNLIHLNMDELIIDSIQETREAFTPEIGEELPAIFEQKDPENKPNAAGDAGSNVYPWT